MMVDTPSCSLISAKRTMALNLLLFMTHSHCEDVDIVRSRQLSLLYLMFFPSAPQYYNAGKLLRIRYKQGFGFKREE